MWPLVLRQLILDEPGKGGIELALGLHCDCIEDEGRLARARHAHKHGDPVLRDTQRHSLEVVLSCSDDVNIFGKWCAVFGSSRLHNLLLIRPFYLAPHADDNSYEH